MGLHPKEVPDIPYYQSIVTTMKLNVLARDIGKRFLKIIWFLLKNEEFFAIKRLRATMTKTYVDSKFKWHVHSEIFPSFFRLTSG